MNANEYLTDEQEREYEEQRAAEEQDWINRTEKVQERQFREWRFERGGL